MRGSARRARPRPAPCTSPGETPSGDGGGSRERASCCSHPACAEGKTPARSVPRHPRETSQELASHSFQYPTPWSGVL